VTVEDELRMIDLHRDADGTGLLVGLNCPDCERRAVESYRCVTCGDVFHVHGAYRWSWQDKTHVHEPDDEAALHEVLNAHRRIHGDHFAFVPVRP
jgi:uncharacterized CHY-type Zn-finger protein